MHKTSSSTKKDDWTREELTLRVGYKELAMAVVEQWKKDGKPESELIPFWIDLIKEVSEMKGG